MPGLMSRIRSSKNGIASARFTSSSGRSGRGPTRLISPVEHVPELRQLVEARLAEEAADPGDARVVLLREHRARELLGVDAHGAELAPSWNSTNSGVCTPSTTVTAPEHPRAALAVEDGARVLELDGERR